MIGAVTIPSGVNAVRTPVYTVAINGSVVSNRLVQVDSIPERSGIAPAAVTLSCPFYEKGQAPLNSFDRVTIWLDRGRQPSAVFTGRIMEGPRETFDAPSGTQIQYIANDLRHFLNEGFCSRSYNVPEQKSGRKLEALGVKEIARDIHAEYVAHQNSISNRLSAEILGLDIGSFPSAPVEVFNSRGMPHGEALQRLVSLLGDGSYNLKVVYYPNGGATLRAFKAGSGITQRIVTGTRTNVSANSQPWGAANVKGGTSSGNVARVVNQITIESPRRFIETAVRLAPEFNAADISRADLATAQIPPDANVTNPGYDSGVAAVGRRYAIPAQVDVDGKRRQLSLEPNLLQASYPDAGNVYFRDRKPGPKLVYKFEDADDYQVLDDAFTIRDDTHVELNGILAKTVTGPATRYETHALGNAQLFQTGETKYAVVFSNLEMPFESEPGVLMDLSPYIEGGLAASRNPDGTSPLRVIEGKPSVGEIPNDATGGVLWIDRSSNVVYLLDNVVDSYFLESAGLTVSDNQVTNFLIQGGSRFTGVGPVSGNRQFIFLERSIGEADVDRLQVPTEVWLQATFRSQVPLSVDSDVQGDADTIVKRLTTNDNGGLEVARNYFKFSATSSAYGPPTVTKTKWGITAWDGGTVDILRDDRPGMKITANEQAKTAQEGLETHTRILPAMPTGYRVGARLVENGKFLGNIRSVIYDFAGFDTILEVANQ